MSRKHTALLCLTCIFQKDQTPHEMLASDVSKYTPFLSSRDAIVPNYIALQAVEHSARYYL